MSKKIGILSFLCAILLMLSGCSVTITADEETGKKVDELLDTVIEYFKTNDFEDSVSSETVGDTEINTSATVLDNGVCGDTLQWELLSNGTLHIFGTGRMYDYVKYTQPSPWYKYRDEPYISEDGKTILNPDGSTYLDTKSYYNDNPNGYKIENIVIDEGVSYIGDWAFYRVCVDELTIPEGVEETGIFCIRFSPSLKVLNLPNSLKIIDDFGVSRNFALTTLNIGDSLEKVGTGGFRDNSQLESIILPDTCTSINRQLSPSYTGATIDYSATGLMENCTALKTVDFGKVDKIPQRTCLGASVENIVIPNTVKSIEEYAFYSCTTLKTVTFEDGSICTSINYLAFSECKKLESISGGISLKTLGYYAEYSKLKEFEFSDSNERLEVSQFCGCSLISAKVGDKITTIPAGWMMYNTKLETLYISNSVTKILDSAFTNCTSLKDIYYSGTLEEWNKISKTQYWSNKAPSTCIVHFTDGSQKKLSECK